MRVRTLIFAFLAISFLATTCFANTPATGGGGGGSAINGSNYTPSNPTDELVEAAWNMVQRGTFNLWNDVDNEYWTREKINGEIDARDLPEFNAGTYSADVRCVDNYGSTIFYWNGSVENKVDMVTKVRAELRIAEKLPYTFRVQIPDGITPDRLVEYEYHGEDEQAFSGSLYFNERNGQLEGRLILPLAPTGIIFTVRDTEGNAYQTPMILVSGDTIVNSSATVTTPISPAQGFGRVEFEFIFPNEQSVPYRLVRCPEYPTIYVLYGNRRFAIPRLQDSPTYQYAVMASWGYDWDRLETVSLDEIESTRICGIVTIRPGTYLVKSVDGSSVYAVEYCDTLRRIASEEAAIMIYGENVYDRIIEVPDLYWRNYTILPEWMDITILETDNPLGGSPLKNPSAIPAGSIYGISWDNLDQGILIGSRFSERITENGLAANRFDERFFVEPYLVYNPTNFRPINDYRPELEFYSAYVNPETIDSVNGGLLEEYKGVSYIWNETMGGLPRNVKIGDILEFTYNDGTFSYNAQAAVIEHPSIDGEYYCEVQWPEYLVHYGSLENYTIRNTGEKVSTGLAVSLSPDTPASQAIGGRTLFTKVIMNAMNRDIQVNYLGLGASGFFQIGDLQNVVAVDMKSGSILAEFMEFPNIGGWESYDRLTIPANQSMEVGFYADPTPWSVGSKIALHISNINAENPQGFPVVVTGLPVSGNAMEIVDLELRQPVVSFMPTDSACALPGENVHLGTLIFHGADDYATKLERMDTENFGIHQYGFHTVHAWDRDQNCWLIGSPEWDLSEQTELIIPAGGSLYLEVWGEFAGSAPAGDQIGIRFNSFYGTNMDTNEVVHADGLPVESNLYTVANP